MVVVQAGFVVGVLAGEPQRGGGAGPVGGAPQGVLLVAGHFAVNARAVWLLIKAFAEHHPADTTTEARGRIVALTSDHAARNLPYGASKGALDRIVVAAAVELADRGIRANVINPGPIDTGWMSPQIRQMAVTQTPAGRLGTPADTADLVRFLMSDAGGWITGQVLYSNGGFRTG